MTQKSYIWLITAFFCIFFVKFIAILLVVSPTIFGDEYAYTKIAWSIFHQGTLAIHGIQVTHYPPLYPIILSWTYLFDKPDLIYLLMKIINALLSTLIIIPAFLICREFFNENESKSLALLISIMPFSFATAPYIMSENLFSPLFLASVYLLYKSLTTHRKVFAFLAGAFIGLTILTRVIGAVFFAVIGVLLFYSVLKKKRDHLRALLTTAFVAALFVALWLILSYLAAQRLVFIENLPHKSILGFWKSLFAFVLWCITNLLYMLLATGGLFALSALFFKPDNEKKRIFLIIVIVLVFGLVLFLARRAIGAQIKEITIFGAIPGRLIGRYLDFLLPLIIISGYLGLLTLRDAPKLFKISIITTIIIMFGSLLFYFPLVPFNNISLSTFGALKTGLEYLFSGRISYSHIGIQTFALILLIVLSASFLAFVGFKKLYFTPRRVFMYTLLFFLATDIISISASAYNSRNWNLNEQLQLGKYANQLEGQRVIIDSKYCSEKIDKDDLSHLCTSKGTTTFVGFWINKEIRVSPIDEALTGDIIITRETLKEDLVKKTEHGINVYLKK